MKSFIKEWLPVAAMILGAAILIFIFRESLIVAIISSVVSTASLIILRIYFKGKIQYDKLENLVYIAGAICGMAALTVLASIQNNKYNDLFGQKFISGYHIVMEENEDVETGELRKEETYDFSDKNGSSKMLLIKLSAWVLVLGFPFIAFKQADSMIKEKQSGKSYA